MICIAFDKRTAVYFSAVLAVCAAATCDAAQQKRVIDAKRAMAVRSAPGAIGGAPGGMGKGGVTFPVVPAGAMGTGDNSGQMVKQAQPAGPANKTASPSANPATANAGTAKNTAAASSSNAQGTAQTPQAASNGQSTSTQATPGAPSGQQQNSAQASNGSAAGAAPAPAPAPQPAQGQ